MMVSSRIKMDNYELKFTNDGNPKYLTYQHDSFYIVKVHGQLKFAYLGYLLLLRVLVYCSDWHTHPFTDGHPSRFKDELGKQVLVHFWNISNTNIDNIESFAKTIKWKVFKDKKVINTESNISA